MIKQLVDPTDIRWPQVFDIWLSANIDAHKFIDASYWKEAFPFVKEMLPQAIVYVYEENQEILGFVGLEENNIAGIFVKNNAQGKGIGKQMLKKIKGKYDKLSLSVYVENRRALNFYIKEGFEVVSELIDETGHLEKTMDWKKDSF
ncbi:MULTISPECIES: GNAT family N-acetyltransferase [Vagococcus]|uniref:Probable acetyltransferase n=1 Tax=Vagococcus fluvialis bH819 TaxID=1255619 RepID=A0A1X6WN22_9ENTE|nr:MULTISPECIES: GNAT family N-acetyltransferase [Vagococcus]SLM85724.1 Probable acetyltransferase [Vagococcus fluvialis bH819]HCM90146.1 GNAT family N-acetyltransferase [Vagococcus sp.]